MDMALPVIAGDEAVRLIRRSPTLVEIPVIALTAHTGADEVAAMFAAGCDEVEAKPVELPRLLAKMARLLTREGDPHG
jgi:CheY-like chemotaxis protein